MATFDSDKPLSIPVAEVFLTVSLACSFDLINLGDILLLKMHILSIDDMIIS